jgi:hypothetical protein
MYEKERRGREKRGTHTNLFIWIRSHLSGIPPSSSSSEVTDWVVFPVSHHTAACSVVASTMSSTSSSVEYKLLYPEGVQAPASNSNSNPQAQQQTQPPATGIEIGGWRVTTQQGSISTSDVLEAFEHKSDIKAPEMSFLDNYLQLDHPQSGIR